MDKKQAKRLKRTVEKSNDKIVGLAVKAGTVNDNINTFFRRWSVT